MSIKPQATSKDFHLRDVDASPAIDSGGEARHVALIGGIVTSLATRLELAHIMLSDVFRLRAGSLDRPRVITASNGFVVAQYHRSPAFRAMIDKADLIDADGMSLVFASRLFLRHPLRERTATTDFIEDACRTATEHGIKFYFLGAKQGVADRAADRLKAQFPGLSIVGTRNGYFTDDELDGIAADIAATGAEVVWLGLGSPRQEDVAYRLRDRLTGVAWIRTCGGLFDHCSGAVPRAPKLVQRLGLEWLHRVIIEPSRLGRRYVVTNPIAAYHLLTKTRDI